MGKPDPALLDSARFPFSCRIEPRFSDLDTNMHINNVALMGILEEARVRFHRASGYHQALGSASSMLVSLQVDYLGEGFYPQPLDVSVAADQIGRSSHALLQLARQDERTVAFARATVVLTRDGKPEPLPDSYRDSVAPWMLRT